MRISDNEHVVELSIQTIYRFVSESANIIDLTSIFYYDEYIGHIMYSAEKDGL